MDTNFYIFYALNIYYSWLYSTADTCAMHNSGDQSSLFAQDLQRLHVYRYSTGELRHLDIYNRRYKHTCPPELTSAIKGAGLWNFRRGKGGKRKATRKSMRDNYTISVITGNRPVVDHTVTSKSALLHRSTSLSTLKQVVISNSPPPNHNLNQRRDIAPPASQPDAPLNGGDSTLPASGLRASPPSPSLYLLNAASLAKPHAIQQLETELLGQSTDVAIITETGFKKHHSDVAGRIAGYNYFRRDRVGRRGGGVAIYFKDNILYTIITPLSDLNVYETLWIAFHFGADHYIICGIYHPPKPIYDISLFKSFLYENVDHFSITYPQSTIILAGDLNQLDDSDIVLNTGLQSLVHQPTRGTNVLDRVYVSSLCNYNVKVVKSAVKSDHCAVVAYSGNMPVLKNKTKKVLNFRIKSPQHNAMFLEYVSGLCFNSILDCQDFQLACDVFYDVFLSLFNTFFPVRVITVSDCDPPFVTAEVKSLLRKKNKLMHANRIAEASSIADKIGKIITRSNASRLCKTDLTSVSLWKEVAKLTGKAHRGHCPANVTADSLNRHYSAISTDPNFNTIVCKSSAIEEDALHNVDAPAVFSMLDKLKRTAAGPDELPFWFIRLAAPVMAEPLAYVINLSLQSGALPKQWKEATIHPIPKVSNPTALVDFRPISIVSILSRITERLVVRDFFRPALAESDILHNQFAYQPTCSTTAALIAMLHHISFLLQTEKCVHVISFDYSKAFDTVSHHSVTSSLMTLNLPDNIFNWTADFLSERSHETRFLGQTSNPAYTTAGVIQGSVLGPTLFNVATSDLTPVDPLNKYFRYADDGYLIVPGSNAGSITHEINHHKIWAESKNLKINVNKCKEIVICPRRTASPPATAGVQRVDTMTILGVNVDDRLTFQHHASQIVAACNQSLYPLRMFRQFGLSEKHLHLVFSAKVIPKLLYAASAWWGYMSKSSKIQLQAFLRRAIKFKLCSPNTPTLEELVEKQDRKLFSDITSRKSHCLASLLPPRAPTTYNLRPRGHNYSLPKKDDKEFINRCLYKFK